MKGNDYKIYIGNDLIGFAKDVEDDMPRRSGRSDQTLLFDKYRELFGLENELVDTRKWANERNN